MSEVANFKATDFRQLGLYTFLVFMKRYLSEAAYYQFLCLRLAYRMISSDVDKHLLQKAQSMFEVFVRDFTQYCKGESLGYNVHNLLHLVDEDRRLGVTVDKFSAYQFENCIRMIGRLVRKPSNELHQISNRIQEYTNCNFKMGINQKNQGIIRAPNKDSDRDS